MWKCAWFSGFVPRRARLILRTPSVFGLFCQVAVSRHVAKHKLIIKVGKLNKKWSLVLNNVTTLLNTYVLSDVFPLVLFLSGSDPTTWCYIHAASFQPPLTPHLVWPPTRSRKSVWGVAWLWSFGLCWRHISDQWHSMPVIHHVRSPASAAKIFPSLCIFNFLVTSRLYYEWLCIFVVLLCFEGIVRRRLFSGFMFDVYFSVTYLPVLISVRQKDSQNYSCRVDLVTRPIHIMAQLLVAFPPQYSQRSSSYILEWYYCVCFNPNEAPALQAVKVVQELDEIG